MLILAYDVETYKDLFTAVFKDVNSDKEWIFKCYKEEREDFYNLVKFLERHKYNLTLVGHNSIRFDDVVLQGIIQNLDIIKAEHLYVLGQKLIKSDNPAQTIKNYWDLYNPKDRWWVTLDTMEVTRVNQIRIGLKHAGIVLEHETVQDLPYKPDVELTLKMADEIVQYNINDVDIQKKFYWYLKENFFDKREKIAQLFELDGILTANDTGIGKKYLDAFYPPEAGVSLNDIKDLRSNRTQFPLSECMAKTIQFDTAPFQKLQQKIGQIWAREKYNFRYPKIKHFYQGIRYDIGIGGLHSKDDPAIFKSTDDTYIIDADVTSYYPYLMILNDFYPEHLGSIFPKVLEKMVLTRVDAKKRQGTDPEAAVLAQTLKIAINSVYGLMGSKYYWLYDSKALVSVTISGQLYLLDLIEKLGNVGIQTISANTDGITCKVDKEQLETYFDICDAWQTRTKLQLEFAQYDSIYRRDVNNYLVVKSGEYVNRKFYPKDGVKAKGVFVDEVDIKKGYYAPVIPKAVKKWFLEGVTPDKFISEYDNIHHFFIAQRVDPSKFNVFQVFSDKKDEMQQKTNRYFVGKRELAQGLVKRRPDGTEISLIAGQTVVLANELYDDIMDDVDYKFYINEAWKIIDKIDPPMKALF